MVISLSKKHFVHYAMIPLAIYLILFTQKALTKPTPTHTPKLTITPALTLQLTHHAYKRIKERNINTQQIITVIKNGYEVLGTKRKNSPHGVKFFYNGTAVVCDTKKKVIITVIPKTYYPKNLLKPISFLHKIQLGLLPSLIKSNNTFKKITRHICYYRY
jgi:hypothetical protein